MAGFIPTRRAGDLYLWIGTAATGSAVQGSHDLTLVQFAQLPGQPAATTLTAADVGCIVAISGGGPVSPYQQVTNQIQGSTFVTTIASVVSGTHATLTDAPDTTYYNSGFYTVVVYRRCLFQMDQIEYSGSIAPGTRDTLRFRVLSKTSGGYIDRFSTIALGQPVYFRNVDPDSNDEFGGYIDTVTVQNYPGVDGVFSWECTCASWAGLATRRQVPPAIPQTLTGPGNVVFAKTVFDYLSDDGVGVIVYGSPATITLGCPVGANINALLDQTCQLLTTPTQGWFWTTDAWKNFILSPYAQTSAPWDILDGYDLFAGQVPEQVSIQLTHNQMANVSYALGQNVLLNALNATFYGNGQATTFNTPLQLGTQPAIVLNGVAQTVGILGVETGKQWYWNQGSTTITQDSSGTPLATTDALVVAYQTETPGVAQFPVEGSLVAQNQAEGTSGIYNHTTQISQPITPNDLLTAATTYGNQYGDAASTVTAVTLRTGLKTGQTQHITFANAGIDGDFLIATVKLTSMNNVLRWDYTAFGGANIGDGLTGLVQFINRGNGSLALATPVPVIGSQYAYSRPITIHHAQVPAPLGSFPLVVWGTFDWLRTVPNGGFVVNNNGYDIIFSTTPDGANPVAFERVSYDPANGQCVFWALVPNLSDTVDTVLYICFGNGSVSSDQQNPQGVWAPLNTTASQPNTNFHGVYHLEEAASPYKDSSGYGNDSNAALPTYPAQHSGGLFGGKCQSFSGSNGIQLPPHVLNNGSANTALTFEVWVKTTQSTDGSMIECYGGPGNHGAGLAVAGASSGKASFGRDDGGAPSTVLSTAAINDGAWHYIAGTIGGNVDTNVSKLYVDGVAQGTPGAGLTTGFTNAIPTGLGQTVRAGVYPFGTNGLLDEARASQWPRSAGWIACCYANQRPGSTFTVIGNQSGGTTTNVVANPSGTVTHSAGALTADQPVFGNAGGDLKVGAKQGATDKAQMASGAAGAAGLPLVYDASGNAVTGVAGELIPAGGTTGQVLGKVSGTDYDVSWQSNDDDIQVNAATSLNIIQVAGAQVWIGQTEIQINGTFI